MSYGTLRLFVQNTLDEWGEVRLADLQFWHSGDARLTLTALLALSVLLLIARVAIGRMPGRHRLAVPAILKGLSPSYFSFFRHVPLVLFLLGLPLFLIALS